MSRPLPIPGWSDAEHQRLVETMLTAGFPACAQPKALAKLIYPVSLAECPRPGKHTIPGVSCVH
jgi:hypothetical protein